jgi:hypothetical protein
LFEAGLLLNASHCSLTTNECSSWTSSTNSYFSIDRHTAWSYVLRHTLRNMPLIEILNWR